MTLLSVLSEINKPLGAKKTVVPSKDSDISKIKELLERARAGNRRVASVLIALHVGFLVLLGILIWYNRESKTLLTVLLVGASCPLSLLLNRLNVIWRELAKLELVYAMLERSVANGDSAAITKLLQLIWASEKSAGKG